MVEKVTYRNMLGQDFEQRCEKNARYSLRAYARHLGISPTSLSLIFNRKQGLSAALARKIATKMNLTVKEQSLFCDSAESEHSRSTAKRELARVRMHQYDSTPTTMQLETFKVISDWYHLAIIELTQVKGFVNDVHWISKALSVPEKAIELAIERLKTLGFLEETEGKLHPTKDFAATPSDIPSHCIKKFHQQILKKAEEALFVQPIEQRDFSTVVFTMDEKDLIWAKQRIKEFRRDLMARLEQAPSKTKVFALSTQFFSLQGEHK